MQLALIGTLSADDSKAFGRYNGIVTYAAGDPDIYILSNLNNVGTVEVNAFQVQADAIIQMSILDDEAAKEALWKARPTVAGRPGGLLDLESDNMGWRAGSSKDCASACVEILRNSDAAAERAARGKEWVRANFLAPHRIRDWLLLFNRMI